MLDPGATQSEGQQANRARTPKAREKREKTEKFKNAEQSRMGQMTSVGRMLAGCPMTADELCEQWAIAADDVETITVKILRQRMGTQEQELMESVPLVDYDGERIAANHGPGTYYLRPGGRKYAKNAAKLPVSDSLARACGYGRLPVTASDLVAERTIRAAIDGPSNPDDLLSAIERIMDRREAEKARHFINPTGAAAGDPLAAMRGQFEQIQMMMGFMAGLEERAIKTVEARMGRGDFDAKNEDTNTSLLEKLLPKALEIFGQMMTNRNPAVQSGAIPKPAAAALEEKPLQAEEKNIMPALSQDEQKAIGGAVAMLRPFGNQLVEMARSMDDSEIVQELEGYIPDNLLDSLKALGITVSNHGAAVLSVIHPGLASDRWAAILSKLVITCEA